MIIHFSSILSSQSTLQVLLPFITIIVCLSYNSYRIWTVRLPGSLLRNILATGHKAMIFFSELICRYWLHDICNFQSQDPNWQKDRKKSSRGNFRKIGIMLRHFTTGSESKLQAFEIQIKKTLGKIVIEQTKWRW